MKIGIDISQVPYGTGVSYYTKELIRSLLEVDRENEYLLFGGYLRRRKDLTSFSSSLSGKFSSRFYPFPPTLADIVWNRLHLLKIERFMGKVDVYHSSDWAQAPSDAFKVTTVHDLAPIKFPKLTHKRIISAHYARLKWVVKEVDRVIVPSEATKNDLLELGMNEEKIRVIYEAASKVFRWQGEGKVREMKKRYKLRDYIISIGMGGRKNTDRLIEAFEHAKAGKDLTLVLVGAGEIKERRGVRHLGMVDDNELAVLLSGARALAFPSFYEGFGLPILQAFGCGTPVVTSNISSMAEIAGGAAILVDPYSVPSIAEGIRKAISGPKALVKKGLERIGDFSWEKAALATINVYKEASK
jgi:glycosyltransferase involved in cell wall biosynthesis